VRFQRSIRFDKERFSQLGNHRLIYNLVLGNHEKSLNLNLLIINIMKKLNFLGIGPKIASVLLPYLILSIVLSTHFKLIFCYIPHKSPGLFYSGLALLLVGLVFYSFTVRLLIKGLNETRLVTNGAFFLCQNPLYTSMILFIIPALSLIINSWLVLTSSIIGYILFKIFIKAEYIELEKFFGESYLTYKKITPEFFPFPFKKWFS
jgi:protein-S-isoprenylcysteine O-methyltransferase Ste14